MHLITLSTPRWLISGVDITPSITRQEYDFFLFHYKPYNLCTSHYNQPFNTIPFSCVALIIPFHLLIFFSAYLFRELTSGVYEPPLHLWFMWLSGGCSHHYIVKCLFYQTSWEPDMPSCGPLAVAPTGRMLARYSGNSSAVWYDSTVLAPQEEAAQIPTPVRELDEYHHPAPNIQHTS